MDKILDKEGVEYLKEIVEDKTCVNNAIKNGKDQELYELMGDYTQIKKCISHLIQDHWDILVPDEGHEFVLGRIIQDGVAMWLKRKIINLGEE